MNNPQTTANDWYRLLEATVNIAQGQADARCRLLVNRLLRLDQRQQWLDWQPDEEELKRLQILLRQISLLRNPNYLKDVEKTKQSRRELEKACSDTHFPWPEICQGIAFFMGSAPHAAGHYKKNVKHPPLPVKKATLQSKFPLDVGQPRSPDNIWLAIGDETGNWDYESNTAYKRGLSLTLAPLTVWQQVFNETIDGQTVRKRMARPLQNLPDYCKKSKFHHCIDAFSLKNQHITPELIDEIQQNLAWLAEHPRLITLGFSASKHDLFGKLTHSKDASQALGKGYAALLAYVMPFLAKNDVLLLGFDFRSENQNTEAVARTGDKSVTIDNKPDRFKMDRRGFLSACRDTLLKTLKTHMAHQHDWDKRFDLCNMEQLVQHETIKQTVDIQPDVWKGLADLGASLLQVQNNKDWKQRIQLNAMSGVRFFKVQELIG